MFRKTTLPLVLLAMFFVAPIAIPVSACPNCKDSIPTGASENTGMGDASAGVSSGFNASIYLMLISFVGVLGMVGYTLYRGVRGSNDSR